MKDTTSLSVKYGKLKPTVTRKYVPLMSDFFMNSYADVKNYQKLFFVDYYTRCGYLSGKFYYGDEAAEFGDVIFVEEDKKSGFIKKIFSTIYAYGEKLLVFSEELQEIDYSDKSMKKLLEQFKQFSERYRTFVISLMGFNIQFPIENRLKNIIKNRKNPNEDLNILSFPRKDNFAVLEQANLLKIGILVKQHNIKKFEDLSIEILEKIQEHITEFGWINARGGQAEPWSEKEIFERIMHTEGDFSQKLVEFENHKFEFQEKTERLLKELNADEEIINLVDIAKELVYFRTYRTDYMNKTFSNIKPLLEAIAKKRNLTYREIIYLRIKEIEENKEVEKDEIERRIIDYALITIEPNKLLFASDHEKIKRLKEDYCEEPVVTSEVAGRSAFVGHGKVRGTVKIIIDKSDLGKINKGDIMVSPMTTPDFVVAMEKAAAFVTDEGGITCHAAIVAREMKKPCIIGTETATQSLKDGDLVEVDAKKGIVKIIKKAE
jgi:phosphohistidine swiveling domain-containing protein